MCKTSLDLIKTREIYLSKDEYDASLSRVAFKLGPVDDEKWTQIRDIPLRIVSKSQDYLFLGS